MTKIEAALTLENAGWPVLLVNSSGAILRANPAAVKTFGATVEGEMPLSAIWTSENGAMAEQFLLQWDTKPAPPATLKFCLEGGIVRSFLTAISPVVENKEKLFLLQLLPPPPVEPKESSAEAQVQKQKFDFALQLARTVSLDFNNLLTSILGHTSLLLTKAEADHPWRNSLLEVEKSAGRAAELAADLGSFSRQDKDQRAQAGRNINTILQRAIDVFEHGDGKNVKWTLQFERKPFAAKFDEAKIQQAFAKVFENAVQATKGAGLITVQTRNVELAQPTQDRDVRLVPGTYMCVEITDDGPGIAADVLPRIFEPFFTTKGGKHRGLGLAWVYGIVTNHGGGVAVSSTPGNGTSVRVYLPAEKRIVDDHHVSGDNLKGNQRILMVDDEELLLTMGQTVLSSFGYEVLTTTSGNKALDILSNGGKKIDLLITDLVMPTMNGRELIEEVRKISPQTRILCTSGYVPPPAHDEGTYLQKPFTSQGLLLKVKEVLTA